MKAETFERISQQAESLAERRPRLYRSLLVAMAVAGYAYIGLVLLVLLGLVGGLIAMIVITHRLNAVAIKFVIFLGAMIVVLARALWVRVEPPAGVPLQRTDAPKLFALLDEVRVAVRAPPVERVVLAPELNASVVQVPLFGILGWHRNYLTIGLPLLHALDAAQFRAVMAHEFGHLSGAHGKLGVWIYRIHQTWGMVAATFGERKSVMRFVFLPVVKGYLPRFSAFSLAQIRRHEYAADQCASEAAGVDAASTALVRLRILGELEQEAWEPVYRRVNVEKDPPAPMASLQEALTTFRDAARSEAWLARALREPTEGGDTHPALADRLAAISGRRVDAGVDSAGLAREAFRSGPSAAVELLEGRLANLTAEVDAFWRKQIADGWRARHEQVQQHRVALAEMQVKAERGTLKDEEQWMRALLSEEVDGIAALPLYQAFLERHPDDNRALFAVGRVLLGQRDARGVPLVRRAIDRAPDIRAVGSQILAHYYYETGDLAASRQWRFSAEDASQEASEMEAERANLTTSERFTPHDLDAALVDSLRERVAAAGDDLRAYLVRRKVRHSPEVPCYVLAIRRVVPWWKREDSAANVQREREVWEAVLKNLSAPCDLRVFIVRRSGVLSRIARVKDSRIC